MRWRCHFKITLGLICMLRATRWTRAPPYLQALRMPSKAAILERWRKTDEGREAAKREESCDRKGDTSKLAGFLGALVSS